MKTIILKTISAAGKCLPRKVRRSSTLQKIKNTINNRLLGHDGIYNEDYYQHTVEGPAAQSAPVICRSIVNGFRPGSLVDVGCGTGALMEAVRQAGIRVKGFEYSEAALAFCRKRNLDVTKFDLEKDVLTAGERFDVAVSMEVAEHLPASVADKYVDLLTRLSDTVVFTAAPPGQGGQDHVNEQPPEYWIEKFAGRGLGFDNEVTKSWRDDWQSSGRVAEWYYKNLLVFRKAKATQPVS